MNKIFFRGVAIDFPHPCGSCYRFSAPFRKLRLISRINDFFRKLLLILHTLPSFLSHVVTLKPSEMNKRLLPEVAIGFTWDPRYSVCCATIWKLLLISRSLPEVGTDLPHPSGSCDWFPVPFRKLRFISRSLPEVAIDFPHPFGSCYWFSTPFDFFIRSLPEVAINFPDPSGSCYWFSTPFLPFYRTW